MQIFTESITAIGGGTVGSAKEEVVVATYSGRVLGLTQDPVSSKPISHEVAAKIEALKLVSCASTALYRARVRVLLFHRA